jgi:hypothetical protein
MKKILCLLLILVSIRGIGYAQNAGQPVFSTDQSQFIAQVEDMFKLLKRDDTKQLTDEFASAFNKIPADAQQQFITLCSEMKQHHLTTYPYFFNLLQAAIEGQQNQTASSQIGVWIQATLNVFDNQKSGTNKDFTNFIEFSHILFSKNALYSNEAKTWRTTSTGYTIKYDKEPIVIINNTDLVASTNGDSMFIHQTGGVYYPLEYTWSGTKGKVDWARAGLDADFAYCTFEKYTIQCQHYVLQTVI